MVKNLKKAGLYGKSLIKWVFLSVLVGLIGGVVGSLFHICIDYVTELRMEHAWILFGLPLGGVLIAALYSLFKKAGEVDTNRVLDAVRTEEKVPFVMAPLIFLSTVITHLFGGSAGREGAALQLGGSIGYRTGKIFRLGHADLHIIVMAGMSAVFSALFGTPLAAAIFAIEVVSVGIVQYAALVPSVTAAITAFGIAGLFGIAPVRFLFISFPPLNPATVAETFALAVLCALVGILFCTSIHKTEHLFEKFLPNKYMRTFAGAVLVIFLTLLVGSQSYNGAGMNVIEKALLGEANPEAFLLKILFTAITIAAGFKGGEIVPAFFIGSTFGAFIGPLLGLEPSFAAAMCFIGLFTSVVNCPVASLLLALEVFGGEGILYFAVICAVTFMMSGNFSLYKSQRIVYSKLDAHLMDVSENEG